MKDEDNAFKVRCAEIRGDESVLYSRTALEELVESHIRLPHPVLTQDSSGRAIERRERWSYDDSAFEVREFVCELLNQNLTKLDEFAAEGSERLSSTNPLISEFTSSIREALDALQTVNGAQSDRGESPSDQVETHHVQHPYLGNTDRYPGGTRHWSPLGHELYFKTIATHPSGREKINHNIHAFWGLFLLASTTRKLIEINLSEDADADADAKNKAIKDFSDGLVTVMSYKSRNSRCLTCNTKAILFGVAGVALSLAVIFLAGYLAIGLALLGVTVVATPILAIRRERETYFNLQEHKAIDIVESVSGERFPQRVGTMRM